LRRFLGEQKVTDPYLKKVYSHLKSFVLRGGKRLRPLILLMAYESFGKDPERIIPAAISVELLHCSTLIHDDIMDEDSERRGKPSLHEALRKERVAKRYAGSIFSNTAVRDGVSDAICLGNMLYSLGLKSLSQAGSLRAVEEYNKAFFIVNHGQIMDMRGPRTEDEYISMVEQKTAWLFSASAAIGGILAGVKKTQLHSLREFAGLSATAFQIKDDLLDLTPKKGHEMGSDIRKGKKTLVMIKALEMSKEKEFLLGIPDRADMRQIRKAIRIMHSCGAVSYCENLARDLVAEAKKHVLSDQLAALADYFVERGRRDC